MPLLKDTREHLVQKDKIIEYINLKNPVIEIGDISIFVTADDFINRYGKVAVLSNDYELNKRYEDSKNVMVMDYNSIILNRL